MATKNEVAVPEKPKGSTAVAAYDYGEDAGAGFENTKPSDFKPSFLRVLQSNSPLVVDEYPGAKAGLIWDNITNEFFPEVQFVPAVREHVYVAWKPRNEGGGGGEGFGGIFQLSDPMVVKQLSTIEDKFARGEDGKIILARTPDGEYQLVETVYYHGVQVLGEAGGIIPATVPLSSTGLPLAGTWFTKTARQIIPGSAGKPYPLFAHVFKLGSMKVEKRQNKWYVLTEAWANGSAEGSRLDPASDLYKAAKSVATAFKEGKARVDYAQAGSGEAAGGATKKDSEIPF